MSLNKITMVTLLTLICSVCAISADKKSNLDKISINEFVLPSEVKSLQKHTGAIYYNKSIKGKALIPVHFWGSVSKSGLHFVPVDTNFISALSMAGGPSSTSDLEKIKLFRRSGTGQKEFKFNLSEGGDNSSHNFIIQPGDSVFIPRDTWKQDRSYYTSLINVGVTVLTGILLYRQVENN
jgi:hypothetical protein